MTRMLATLAAGVCMVAVAAPARAQERDYQIPAGSLKSALSSYIRQSGRQLVFRGSEMTGVRSNGARGKLTAEAALAQILAGTRYSAKTDSSGAVAIIRSEEPAPSDGDDAAGGEDIVVTGSRIRRAGFDTLQPANSVSGDQASALGYNTAADLINQLPAFGTPTSGNGGQNEQTVGQNFVNAFGLGTGRTLTLLNGRRVVTQASPGNSVDPGQQVDLNIIPTIMIDRVETIYTGGAPIYGADAIAGTVNVILKSKYKGLMLDGQNGISSRGDAHNFRMGALAGADFAGGRGHIVVAGEYNRVDGLAGTARESASTNFTYCNNPANTGARDGIPDQIICRGADALSLVPLTGGPTLRAGNFYGVNRTANAFVQNGEPLLFSLDGLSLVTAAQANLGTPISAAGATGANASANPYVVNQAETNSLLSPTKRATFAAQASFDISSALTAYVEGLYAHTDASDQYSQGGFSSVLFPANGGQIKVRMDNPFLTEAVRTQLLASSPPGIDTDGNGTADTPGFYLARYNQDLLQGAPVYRTQEVYRFVGGLKGRFSAFGSDWNWDASYNYGRTKASVRAPVIDLTRFGLALDAVRNGSGQIVCRVSTDPGAASGIGAARPTQVTSADIGGCLPFNPLGYATSPNMSGVRNYVLRNVRIDTTLEQQVAEATLEGSPFSLPAGAANLAMGLTYRRESARYSGEQQNLGYFVGDIAGPIRGNFHTKEAYAEGVIPILSSDKDFSIPLVRSLTFEGAARIVDNSFSGSDWTWTAGGRLGLQLPMLGDALTIRGNVTQAVRAPAFAELLTPKSNTTGLGNDPCDPRFISDGASPANRAASCAAEVNALKAAGLLPADFALSSFTSSVVNVAVPGTATGNPELRNERSKSWTIGVMIAPSTVPGLRATVDWTDIRISNAIVSTSLSQLFATCYDNGAFGSNVACGRFMRDPSTFQVTNFALGFINAAERRFSGLLADLQYRVSMQGISLPGSLTIGANGFYVHRHQQTINGGDLDIFAGERGMEKYRVQGNLMYASQHLSMQWQSNFVSGGVIDKQATAERRAPGTFGSFWQHDLSVSVMPTDRMELRFIVTNIFDQTDDARRIAAKTTNAVIGGANLFENMIGRTFTVGARVKF